jgi:hypothetical protein
MEKDIINAALRLERAGGENSRATEKLHVAARKVADLIEGLAPVGVDLPRGYIVIRERSNVGSALFLKLYRGQDKHAAEYGVNQRHSYWIDGTGGYLHGDFHCEIPNQSRDGSLMFAKDVAEGLLDEIAEFLEQRAAQSDQATADLEQHLSTKQD